MVYFSNLNKNLARNFYSKKFGFEELNLEYTEYETVIIQCNSSDEVTTVEMTKKEALDFAMVIIKKCS